MVKTTPFFQRTNPLNETMLWVHWAGYAVAQKYQHSETAEYYAIRNGVGIFDTSPLFKYKIRGADATRFLRGVLARDVAECKVGQAQYTVWCNDDGWLLEDGVVLRVAEDEYWLTAAEPNLRYFSNLVGYGQSVTLEDISDQFGLLAIQGPHALSTLRPLSQAVEKLGYFELTQTKVAAKPVIISRTGYTGSPGFEIWVEKDDALAVWDAVMDAGSGYNITPFGQKVLHTARIDAGLLMIDVEYRTARHAWTDEQRSSPVELGFGWMFKNLAKSDRAFIGRRAIERELNEKSSRWKLVGIEVDWRSYEAVYNSLGMIAPKDNTPIEEAMSLYDDKKTWQGHTTSFVFSSILKKHIAMAKVVPDRAKPGTELQLELMINDRPRLVTARVVRMPFYNRTRG